MPFSDFTPADLKTKLGVRLAVVGDLHAAVPEVSPHPLMEDLLANTF